MGVEVEDEDAEEREKGNEMNELFSVSRRCRLVVGFLVLLFIIIIIGE